MNNKIENNIMKTKQLIAFSRGKIYASLEEPKIPENSRTELIGSVTNELKKFGYSISSDAILRLSEEDLIEFHTGVLPKIHSLYHHGEQFKPLYPGFPKQVISKSELELLQDRNRVYSGDIEGFLKDNPWYTKEETEEIERNSYDGIGKTLGLLTPEDFMKIPTQIMSAGNSLHSETKEELLWFLDNYPYLPIPEKIPFKETLCLVVDKRPEYELREINDVLRYAFYKMGVTNLSLPKVEKQIKTNAWSKKKENNPEWRRLGTLNRKTRKDILKRISDVYSKKGYYAIVDAKGFYGHWILLSERVHSGDYAKQYPVARKFFEELQGNAKIYKTWESKLQKKYDNKENIIDIAKFVSERPGEFVRRFDSFLRRAKETGIESDIMDIFLETTGMKNKTLLELLNYYDKRSGDCPRYIKKSDGTLFEIPKKLETLDAASIEFIQDLIIRKVLINIDSRITEKDLQGKNVYIDPETKNIPVPRDMREAVSIIPRGTKFDIPGDKNIIRFYAHWIQEQPENIPDEEQEDLDLHAFLSDGNGKDRNIGWNTGLKSSCAVHSGDVLNRHGNCAEYCDINISKALEQGYRYVSMDIKNYKGRGFDTLPCWMGYMYPVNQTELQNGNDQWIPQDVAYCKEITSKASNIQAWIFDLQERKAMLINASLDDIPINTTTNTTKLIKYFTAPMSFTTYDILKQYYTSRGATIYEQYPDDPDFKMDEELLAPEISLDYTKVLGMIGE